jgi:hypothetical protein
MMMRLATGRKLFVRRSRIASSLTYIYLGKNQDGTQSEANGEDIKSAR